MPVSAIQQTQYRLAQHYLKKLQQANSAIRQPGSGNRTHWIEAIQRDWAQINQWRDWSAAGSEEERARLCVAFNSTATAAVTTQETTAETIQRLGEAVQAAQRLEDPTAEGELNYMLGLNHLRLQQLDAVNDCAERLMNCGEHLRDQWMLGKAWYLLGCISISTGKFDEAEEQYTRSRDLLDGHRPEEMFGVWSGFGHIAFFRGDYVASRDFHQKSLECATSFDDEANVAVAHLSLSGVCLHLHEYNQAEHHATQTLAIARRLRFLALMPPALNMMASVKRRLGELDEAHACYEEVLGITRATLSPEGQINALTGLGRTHLLQNNDEAAIANFNEAIAIAREQENVNRMATVAEPLVHAHVRRGELDLARARLRELVACAMQLKTAHFYAKAVHAAVATWIESGRVEQAAIWAGVMQQQAQYFEPGQSDTLNERIQHVLDANRYNQALEAGRSLALDAVVADIMALLEQDDA